MLSLDDLTLLQPSRAQGDRAQGDCPRVSIDSDFLVIPTANIGKKLERPRKVTKIFYFITILNIKFGSIRYICYICGTN